MENFKIRVILTGFANTSKSKYIYHHSVHKFYDVEGTVDLPVCAILAENSTRKVLIDTGMSSTAIADKYHHPGSVQPEGYAVHEQLKKMGIEAEEITDVIFTHLHWDHVYNMREFVNAKYYVQRKEYEFAVKPIPLYFKSYEEPSLGLDPQFTGCEFELLDGECELFDGIKVYPSPGHSVMHQTVVIPTAKGDYHCIGDLVFTLDNLKPVPEMNYDITPPGRFQDIVAEWNSIVELKKRAQDVEHILAAHDPSMEDLAKNGTILG